MGKFTDAELEQMSADATMVVSASGEFDPAPPVVEPAPEERAAGSGTAADGMAIDHPRCDGTQHDWCGWRLQEAPKPFHGTEARDVCCCGADRPSER